MRGATTVRLRDLGEWTGGNTPSKSNLAYWTNGTIPWVSPKDMKVDEITSSEDRITEAALADGRASIVPEGAVLLVTRSGILAHTLPVAVTKVPVTINQDLKALTPRAGVSAKYVAHAVRGASRRILKQCSKQGTTVSSIETNALLNFEIPMVELDEQDRIVAEIEKQFSRLDESVAILELVKTRLKHYGDATLQAGFANLSKWPPSEVGALCQAVNGRAFKSSEWRTSGIPIIRIQNLKDPSAPFNYFVGKLEDKHRVKRGDLLFAWSGTPGTSFGAHIWQGGAAALNQHIFRIDFDSSQIDPAYFRLALTQNVARYIAQAQGGVGLAHITKKKFMASQIPLPPLIEQEQLVVEIERRLSITAEVDTQIAVNLRRTIRLRQSILSRVLRFPSTDSEIEPTESLRTRQMVNQKLPALPASRKSDAEDFRRALVEILGGHRDGLSVEALFQEAGYQGDQIDAFYRDLSQLADRLDLAFADPDGARWPMSGPVTVRLKR